MKRYIIILSTKDKMVIKIIESQPVDDNNVWDVSAALSKHWLGISPMFPSPQYDIIWGAWDNAGSVQGTVGRHWNWEAVSRESLPAIV